ncbi:hypothetical protein DFR72_11242 [Lentzea flaviverrucosa]|uniref:Uncharacterized protein n=1 Tax=Lentzea flaviverrucosa TaxID=200379 RepID=A0A1H9WDN7_9PSEU|nr:hypothetical protein DFR72_11242 [Lentzea flaviverrucosa]SES31934.1 hypothetical protein SAMN05216195_111264 [Lentzea flaviverrucosa]
MRRWAGVRKYAAQARAGVPPDREPLRFTVLSRSDKIIGRDADRFGRASAALGLARPQISRPWTGTSTMRLHPSHARSPNWAGPAPAADGHRRSGSTRCGARVASPLPTRELTSGLGERFSGGRPQTHVARQHTHAAVSRLLAGSLVLEDGRPQAQRVPAVARTLRPLAAHDPEDPLDAERPASPEGSGPFGVLRVIRRRRRCAGPRRGPSTPRGGRRRCGRSGRTRRSGRRSGGAGRGRG